MNLLMQTGKVEAQEAQEAQVTQPVARPVIPPVGGQPESRPEWFSKRGRTFFSAHKKLIASWETSHPVIEVEARETDKRLAKILKQLGVGA